MSSLGVGRPLGRMLRPSGWRPAPAEPRRPSGEKQVVLCSKDEIAGIRDAGRIAAQALQVVAQFVQPGISTFELDEIAEREIRQRGATPSFKGLYGFKGSICASVNDEIVHGVPNKSRRLKEGDLIKVDIGASLGRFHSDHAMTLPVGAVSADAARLIDVTRAALAAGIAAAQPNGRVRDISAAVEATIRAAGSYGIVRQYVGHGVGVGLDLEQVFHAPPQIPNYLDPERPVMKKLEPGLVIAIEPMVNIGTWDTKQRKGDSWTVYTADGSLSAHFEHTIAITEAGPEILTLP